MKLRLLRYSDNGESTLGLLFINDVFFCYTLEDEKRDEKVKGETRIPEGLYKIKYRKEGGFHNKYKKRFPGLHKGMLHLQNIPGFEYILIHCGNTDDDTAGCILVGNVINNNKVDDGYLAKSSDAYKALYKVVSTELDKGKIVSILIEDIKNEQNKMRLL